MSEISGANPPSLPPLGPLSSPSPRRPGRPSPGPQRSSTPLKSSAAGAHAPPSGMAEKQLTAAAQDKNALKVHMSNGGCHNVKFGEATDIKVRSSSQNE